MEKANITAGNNRSAGQQKMVASEWRAITVNARNSSCSMATIRRLDLGTSECSGIARVSRMRLRARDCTTRLLCSSSSFLPDVDLTRVALEATIVRAEQVRPVY
jgi:hypothetical protein